ncbi:hypothetical protein [Nocardia sp. NRRL S-836]|uniref:hypothetical protein n=1 Tax=Nocardia sp. NRRL S-836 TaxID=1519492 RepID=UPI0006B004B9|nr:hypothetical protein [Nocardia sp. NRRL S-836]KOV81802.1 hypothetical protein ADL03_26845 [Nocardia sp. NRRL S-836]
MITTDQPDEELARRVRSAAAQSRRVRALLKTAGVDLTGLKARTHVARSGPAGVEYMTTVTGFTRPMNGDDTVTEQVDQVRSAIVETLSESFTDVKSDYGWVSVTTRLMTIEEALAWAQRREDLLYGNRYPMFVCCPDEAWNDPEDPWQTPEVQFHGTHRWCLTCMSGCHCLNFVQVLGTEEQGHDDHMRCVWCRATGRAPYEARLAGAMIGEGIDL